MTLSCILLGGTNSNNFQTDQFDPYMGPKQELLQVRLYLGVMAMKEWHHSPLSPRNGASQAEAF